MAKSSTRFRGLHPGLHPAARDHPVPPADTLHGDSLGACMRRVYLLEAAGDSAAGVVRVSQARWPRSCREFAAALARVGSPVQFVLSVRTDAAGGVTCVVASADPSGRAILFRTAPWPVARRYPSADLFEVTPD